MGVGGDSVRNLLGRKLAQQVALQDARSRPREHTHTQILPGRMAFVIFVQSLAAQKSHRKIAVTTVAASGLATIPLQKSQGFSLRRPQKNR